MSLALEWRNGLFVDCISARGVIRGQRDGKLKWRGGEKPEREPPARGMKNGFCWLRNAPQKRAVQTRRARSCPPRQINYRRIINNRAAGRRTRKLPHLLLVMCKAKYTHKK